MLRPKKPLFAIGGKMRSGKDSLGAAIAKYYDVPVLRLATPLKKAHQAMGHGDGEVVKNREWLQDAGTYETSRNHFHFVRLLVEDNPSLKETGGVVVDMRYSWEYAYFKSVGAICIRLEVPNNIRVERGADVSRMGHISEIGLDYLSTVPEAWDVILRHPWHNERYKLGEIEKYSGSTSAIAVIDEALNKAHYRDWCEAVYTDQVKYGYEVFGDRLKDLLLWLAQLSAADEDYLSDDSVKGLKGMAYAPYRWYADVVSSPPKAKKPETDFSLAVKDTYTKLMLDSLKPPYLFPSPRTVVSPLIPSGTAYAINPDDELKIRWTPASASPFPADYGEMDREMRSDNPIVEDINE